MKNRLNILLLDSFNITKSIIAEAFIKKIDKDNIYVISAGIYENRNEKVEKNVIDFLIEENLPANDIIFNKIVYNYINIHFDYVITMSREAKINCPIFVGTFIKLNWDETNQCEILPSFIRDEQSIINHTKKIGKDTLEKAKKLTNSFMLNNIKSY